jgi:acetylornithine deacetylase
VDGQPWDTDPFVAQVIGDRLYGRGVTDMKSYGATALMMVPELLQRKLKRPVHLAFSYDEEVGCIGVRRLIASPYTRALETARIIAGELGLAIRLDDRLVKIKESVSGVSNFG